MTLFPDTMETMLTTMKIHEHSYLGLFLNCGALSRLTPPPPVYSARVYPILLKNQNNDSWAELSL